MGIPRDETRLDPTRPDGVPARALDQALRRSRELRAVLPARWQPHLPGYFMARTRRVAQSNVPEGYTAEVVTDGARASARIFARDGVHPAYQWKIGTRPLSLRIEAGSTAAACKTRFTLIESDCREASCSGTNATDSSSANLNPSIRMPKSSATLGTQVYS